MTAMAVAHSALRGEATTATVGSALNIPGSSMARDGVGGDAGRAIATGVGRLWRRAAASDEAGIPGDQCAVGRARDSDVLITGSVGTRDDSRAVTDLR